MKYVLLGVFALSMGCASYQGTAMPRVANGIEATKSLWTAVCYPVAPVGQEKLCRESKDGINAVVDFYTEVNDAL